MEKVSRIFFTLQDIYVCTCNIYCGKKGVTVLLFLRLSTFIKSYL